MIPAAKPRQVGGFPGDSPQDPQARPTRLPYHRTPATTPVRKACTAGNRADAAMQISLPAADDF
ncbi:MAG: hypothetical protein A2092_02885 [Rhodobacteraceae bacterium GWE1_64_9]|nr:MAG: hypothetical protein A2092_02885 [Rhodobacteraceae bacterium GWE1_64_9]OHC48038.1 MAG: hypothetical protein A2X69_01140 [Rhodobacteraceae bacterium GWF1_65_7]HBD89200.1 hypothetical protein [Gemmobacter sp.]HBU16475.1 hypothetical protein [Gemmobacter sp.]